MVESIEYGKSVGLLWWVPPAGWLPGYRVAYLPSDFIAGITLAAYAIPLFCDDHLPAVQRIAMPAARDTAAGGRAGQSGAAADHAVR
jgi:MFS superfamily sulfate permease-like transporter